MKRKKILVGYIIFLLLIALPVCIYGIIHFNNSTKLATNKSAENTTPQDEPETSENSEIAKIVDRFEGKNLINVKGIPVLCYHAIGDDKTNTLYVSQDKFKEQMQYLKNNGYFTLNLEEFKDYIINNKPVPEKSVLITFDDGYANNYSLAFPILKDNSQNATIAIITDFLNDGFYLSKQQILEMQNNGIEFVSHTTKHQAMNEFSYEDQLKILKDSKNSLESIIGQPVDTFIYPFSKYNNNSKKAVKDAGYSIAFNLDGGIASTQNELVNINRQYVNGNYNLDQFINLLVVK